MYLFVYSLIIHTIDRLHKIEILTFGETYSRAILLFYITQALMGYLIF